MTSCRTRSREAGKSVGCGGPAATFARQAAFRYAVENGVGVFYWIDDACGYAISGSVDRAQLLKIAHIVYGQLAVADAGTTKWGPCPRASIACMSRERCDAGSGAHARLGPMTVRGLRST